MNISEEVFKYVYGEMGAKERALFEDKLLPGSTLAEEVEELSKLKKQIDGVADHYQPREQTLKNILDFSKNYSQKAYVNKKASS